MKFPYFDKQTNDDYNEKNSHANQDHAHQLCCSFKHIYKKGDEIQLFIQCFTPNGLKSSSLF